jgi:general nucleoside transport system ATP-binding protein
MQRERLRMSHVAKSFGSNVALRDVSITLNFGEVHALIGENGAGKSTLMRILAGHLTADAGSMAFEGKDVDLCQGPVGNRQKIGFAEQEGGLIGEFNGAENLLIDEKRGLLADRRQAERRVSELGKKFGGAVDPTVPTHTLPMGQRQRLEILIALARGADVLILDEPTAALGIDDAKRLKDIIRTFVANGGSVFYISHKLNEIKGIADRVTVLRRGAIVGQHHAGKVSVTQLASEMVGEFRAGEASGQSRSVDAAELIDAAVGSRLNVGEIKRKMVCELRGVSARSAYRSESNLVDVDLAIYAGEIVGIAGVIGNGQTTLAEVLAGLVAPQSGTFMPPQGATAHVPEDRHRDAVALSLSICENTMVHFHRRTEFARVIWPRNGAITRYVEEILEVSQVRGAQRGAALSTLSGGNQQKLVLGRELEQKPALLVVHNPFRGLDVRATQDVRDAIVQACQGGAGVVMISSDLEEILQLAHRVVVLFSGRVMGEAAVGEVKLDQLGKMMGGLA